MHKPGYGGWKEIELSEEEQAVADSVSSGVKLFLAADGFSAAEIEEISIEIHKASLTISEEEGRSGAFHMLAGGEPFYSLVVTGGSMTDPTSKVTAYVFTLGQALGSASMTMSDPIEVRHDFKEDLVEKGKTILGLSRAVAKHVTQGAAPKKNGPRP